MNGKFKAFRKFISCLLIGSASLLAQDASEPICLREFVNPPEKPCLTDFLSQMGGAGSVDLLFIFSEQPSFRSEALGIKLIGMASERSFDRPYSAIITYIPYDHARITENKFIQFKVTVKGRKIDSLVQITKDLTAAQKLGSQTNNKVTSVAGSKLYYLIQSKLINSKTDSLLGGWITNPQINTKSGILWKECEVLRKAIGGVIDRKFPQWKGDLDMNEKEYTIKEDINID